MTQRSTLGIEKVPAARHRASGSATRAARHVCKDGGNVPVSAEERRQMIAREAYYRAERRGFAPGHELEDWCEAEATVDRQIGHGQAHESQQVYGAEHRAKQA